MKEARWIVNEIRKVLQAGRAGLQGDLKSMAMQFADRRKQVNDRLRLCRQYISNGMLREALHVAETKPVLLELAAALDIAQDEKKWNELCAVNGWPVAEAIDETAIRLLNSSYGSAQALEPLQKLYHRAVLMDRDNRRCVQLLREISALAAPDNKNWVEDLGRFEEDRLEKIGEELKQADRNNDPFALQSLLDELSPVWTIDVKPMRAAIAASLKRVRELEASGEGKRVSAELGEAYEALDVKLLGDALQRYESLIQEGYFHPEPKDIKLHAEAEEWHKMERERAVEDREFSKDIDQLTVELEKDEPTAEIGRLLRSLTTRKRPIPEELKKRAEKAAENFLHTRHLRSRNKVLFSLVSSVSLITVILLAVWNFQYTKIMGFWVAHSTPTTIITTWKDFGKPWPISGTTGRCFSAIS